jgi:hypothetical protein
MEKTSLKQAGSNGNEPASLHLSKRLEKKSSTIKLIKIAAIIALGGALGTASAYANFGFQFKTPPPLPLHTNSSNAVAAPVTSSSDSVKPSSSPPPPSPPQSSHLASWRLRQIASIQQAFPAIQRLQHTLHTGTIKEAEPILKGSSSIAGLRTPSYQALLCWAMVDPPKDPAVRRAIIRVFTLTPTLSETLPILENAVSDGEPYGNKMKEVASIDSAHAPCSSQPNRWNDCAK